MKALSNPAVTALGATTTIYMVWLAPLASDVHETFFTFPGSITAVVVPLYIGFFATWIFWTVLLFLSRKHRAANTVVWTVLGIIILRELFEGYYALRPNGDPFRQQGLPSTRANVLFLVVLVLLVVVIALLRRSRPHVVHHIKWFGAVVLGFIAFSGVITLVQIAAYTWQARNLNAPRPLHQATLSSHTPPHRVIWILFDELSYNQLYAHRFPGLQLPAFDRLAATATVFTDVRPEGKLTLRIIPALLSGVSDTDIRMPGAGTPLWVKHDGKWREFNPQQTVFQDAINDGYTTAVAGWVFPYCRLLHQQLDHCYWANSTRLVGNLYTTHSIGWNLKQMFFQSLKDRAAQLRIIRRVSAPLLDTPPVVYQDLAHAASDDVNNPAINFMYFHFNVPHPLGFYDRRTGQFSINNGKSYIDNLALCDRFLANLRQEMENNGTWDNTTLVIMGDHSWRTYGWSKDATWTPEENKASNGGQFDDRPGYIVKLAGQTTPARIDTSYEAIRTRSLFDALLADRIQTPQQLNAWVTQTGSR